MPRSYGPCPRTRNLEQNSVSSKVHRDFFSRISPKVLRGQLRVRPDYSVLQPDTPVSGGVGSTHRWTLRSTKWTWHRGELTIHPLTWEMASLLAYLLQTHPGRSPSGSWFCSSHPGTWSYSGSGCRCTGHTAHRHWRGCGSSAWSGWTSSSGWQWWDSLEQKK